MTMLSGSSDDGKTCCILVGSSGCGKSLLVENMSSDGIKRSDDSSTSVTKRISVVKHKSSKLLLMDTIGCEDTGNKLTDDEILKEITNKLAENGAPKIKVIWCVRPEDRSSPKLQTQAKFINALVNRNWNAVQVVVKQGLDDSSTKGARGAASRYTNIKLPVFDLHCLDRVENIKKHKMYKNAPKMSFEYRLEDGFLYSNEINIVMSDKISRLNPSKANLVKEFYHKETGRLVSKMKHTGSIRCIWRHWGYPTEDVNTKTTCPYGHPESDIQYCKYKHGSWVSYWECDDCGKNIKVGHNFYHCFGCCDRGKRRGHSSIVKKCAGMYCTGCGKQTRETRHQYMSCCKEPWSSAPCKIVRKEWSCCGRKENDVGTVLDYKYWDCCNTKEDRKLNKVCGKWKWVPKNFS